MEWLKILLAAPLSYVALFLITKLIGYRQISQLSIFDYVNGITIGSIAAEMATELEKPLQPLLAMAIYCLLVVLTSWLTTHSVRMRRWLTGRTLVLLQNGTLYRENLKKAKLDVNEFLTQCRDSGYFGFRNEEGLTILDGETLTDNLEYLGYNEDWLDHRLEEQNYTVGQIFLATCDREGSLTLFPMEHKAMTRDLFL